MYLKFIVEDKFGKNYRRLNIFKTHNLILNTIIFILTEIFRHS